MANGCEAFGRIIPDTYIDKVFLEEALIDTNNDGTVDIQTPKITVNVKLVDQLNDNGTYSLLGDTLNQQQQGSLNPVDLKEMFRIRCAITTTEASTEAFEETLAELPGVEINSTLNLPAAGLATAGLYSAYTTLNAITSTYTNSDGDVELIKSFTFDLPEGAIIEHLHVFAFVQLETDYLAEQLNLIVPEPLKWKIGKVEQEMVIENSQVVSMRRGFEVQGVTTNNENHVHAYEDLDINGDGYTAYAVHPDESEIRHRHQVIDGVVQSAQSDCWRADPADPESCQELYKGDPFGPFGLQVQGPAGVGPHIHQLQSKWEPISNVQDFRIRDEIDVLIAEFTSLTQTQESFPGQKDIIAPIMSNDSYFSELFLTKDEARNVRFFFAFDYGKFCIEKSKYYHIISKFPDPIKQMIVDNSVLTKFIISKRQVRENPAQNSLGSPVRDRVMDDGSIEIPIVTSLGSNAISEINLLLPNQSPTGGSSLRYFTGIDPANYFPKSDGFYQYSIDIEIIDGFVPIIQDRLAALVNDQSDYESYVALTEIPGVYDRLSRKFTATGINILAPSATTVLDPIVSGYLNVLSIFVDLDSFMPGTTEIKREYYRDKILSLISPATGGIDGVLLFDKLLTLLVSQITNLMKIGHSGGGVEDTVANQPSDRTSLFKPQAMNIKEYFENTIGARYLNESYINNVGNAPKSAHKGLVIYSQAELLAATQRECNRNLTSNIHKSIEEIFGEAGITYNIMPLTTTTTAPTQQLVSAVNFTSFSPGATGDLNVNILSPQDLATPEVTLNIPPEAAFAPFLQSLRDAPESTSDQLQVEVDVLTEFGSTVLIPMYPSVTTMSMRNATFQTKLIGQLVVAPEMGNVFYLCRQTRRSDVEVLNSYFLVSPTISTGATGTTSNVRPGSISAVYNHTHTYTIDAYGNGSTSVGGPDSHWHQITNSVIEEYTDVYGYGPHNHMLSIPASTAIAHSSNSAEVEDVQQPTKTFIQRKKEEAVQRKTTPLQRLKEEDAQRKKTPLQRLKEEGAQRIKTPQHLRKKKDTQPWKTPGQRRKEEDVQRIKTPQHLRKEKDAQHIKPPQHLRKEEAAQRKTTPLQRLKKEDAQRKKTPLQRRKEEDVQRIKTPQHLRKEKDAQRIKPPQHLRKEKDTQRIKTPPPPNAPAQRRKEEGAPHIKTPAACPKGDHEV